ncbi:MAG: hypothetical protein WCP98_19680 [Actinomycetes bacterium]
MGGGSGIFTLLLTAALAVVILLFTADSGRPTAGKVDFYSVSHGIEVAGGDRLGSVPISVSLAASPPAAGENVGAEGYLPLRRSCQR